MHETGPDAQFADYFNALLAQHHLSGAEAARRLKVAQSQVSRWRRGEGGISLENLQRIHEEFGSDLTYLMQLTGLRTSTPPIASSDPTIEAERTRWRAWFDELREKRVPRALWTAYTEAMLAMADDWSDTWTSSRNAAQDALSTPPTKRVSKPRATEPRTKDADDNAHNTSLSRLALALVPR